MKYAVSKDVVSEPLAAEGEAAGSEVDSGYARYVLVILTLAYILCVMDRQVLGILAEDIKADLRISDAQMGFLAGTAYAVFYSTFGIAFGRLADLWNRKKLISIGVAFWSIMAALGGLTSAFLPLASCRLAVAAGEATLSPSALSMLYDYFSVRIRTTVLGVYSGGIYIGAGLGLFVGGVVLQYWHGAWPGGVGAPLGLKAWQAAFMVVSLPGLLLAGWITTLREPRRGGADGLAREPSHAHPFKETGIVIFSLLPGFNWPGLARSASGRKAIWTNCAALIVIVLAGWGLTLALGDAFQWIALGWGTYAAFSWAQGIAIRDPVIFSMIFRSAAMRNMILAISTKMAMGIVLGFWAAPFFQRYYHVGTSEVGGMLGVTTAVAGFAGISLGGVLADRLYARSPRGKLYVCFAGQLIAVLAGAFYLCIGDLHLSYAGFAVASLANSMAYGPGISTVNDLSLPRGRATTSAFSFMVGTFFGVALGPYVAGHISDVFIGHGLDAGEALRRAMLLSLAIPASGLVLILNAMRHIERDQGSLLTQARALGEDV